MNCPKCNSENVKRIGSCGGFAIYNHLECQDCHFAGGLSRVYTGEEERVDREIKERFTLDNIKDDAKAFVSSIVGY